MPELDPITGKDPSTLTLPQLAERLAMERALREQESDYVRQALDKQAAEYERRLDELNHSHAAAVEAQARTVPRELFDAFTKDNESRRETSHAALGSRLEAAIASLSETVRVGHDSLEAQVEVERNARIRAEGSVAVWRFIAVFLGFPGVLGLLLALLALAGK